jgi:hypothetical protein
MILLHVLRENTKNSILGDFPMFSDKTCRKTVSLSFQCYFPCLRQNHQPLPAVEASSNICRSKQLPFLYLFSVSHRKKQVLASWKNREWCIELHNGGGKEESWEQKRLRLT